MEMLMHFHKELPYKSTNIANKTKINLQGTYIRPLVPPIVLPLVRPSTACVFCASAMASLCFFYGQCLICHGSFRRLCASPKCRLVFMPFCYIWHTTPYMKPDINAGNTIALQTSSDVETVIPKQVFNECGVWPVSKNLGLHVSQNGDFLGHGDWNNVIIWRWKYSLGSGPYGADSGILAFWPMASSGRSGE